MGQDIQSVSLSIREHGMLSVDRLTVEAKKWGAGGI
jgi:hypothetical protein